MGTSSTDPRRFSEDEGEELDQEIDIPNEEEQSAALIDSANEMLDNSLDENGKVLDWQSLEEVSHLFEQALLLNPLNIEGKLGRAFICGLLEDYEIGFKELNEAKILSPSDERVDEMLKELEEMKKESKENNEENKKRRNQCPSSKQGTKRRETNQNRRNNTKQYVIDFQWRYDSRIFRDLGKSVRLL